MGINFLENISGLFWTYICFIGKICEGTYKPVHNMHDLNSYGGVCKNLDGWASH